MKRTMPLFSLALGLMLAVACVHAPKTEPALALPLPPELKKQEALVKAEVERARGKLDRGEKISDANEACLLYLYGAAAGDGVLLSRLGKNGADINARNQLTQETALQMAVLEGNSQSVRRLLELGANPNLEDSRGCPPLYNAITNDNLEVARLLLEHGANPNAVEKVMGTPPLLCITVDNKVELMTLLLKYGADPNARYPRGGATALHLAAMKGHQEATELLLKHGANPNATTAAGTTPLKAAATNMHPELVEILKKYGAR
jgi:ankyrin repeat protein